MCLIALALHASKRFPLVMAGNRDEFLARSTLPLDVWRSARGTSIVGGRDGQDGGSWMGFTPEGRFAVLTNVRNPQAKAPVQPISRGSLVVNWLDSQLTAAQWAAQLDATRFNGFNLIVGNWTTQECVYLSYGIFFKPNQPQVSADIALNAMNSIVVNLVPRQVHGLSNATLNTAWPKTVRLQAALTQALELPNVGELTQALLQDLAYRQAAPDAQLPSTGVALELERALSSAFVSHPPEQPHYGTRSSWVAALDARGQLHVSEATHTHDGSSAPLRQQTLLWPTPSS
jgi:uncharacterized protein with NRDE domain